MTRFGWAAVVVAGIFLCAHPARAQDAGKLTAELDRVVSTYTPDHVFMGSVLVAQGDRVLLSKGYGLATATPDVAITPQTRFRIGSLTKQFTAALTLLLVEDGKLRLTDRLDAYLDDAPAAWGGVTVAQLLNHASGIADFTRTPDFQAWSTPPRTPSEVIGLVAGTPLEFTPGQRFAYSSTNYILLGRIVEKVTGKPYAEVLRERLLQPAGLNDTGMDADGLQLAGRALGYTPTGGGKLAPMAGGSLTVPWTAGAMYSTTPDLLRWEQALFGGKILSPASLQTMTAAGPAPFYAMGLGLSTIEGVKTIDHGGAIEGFHSYLIYAPEKALTVAVLSNIDGFLPDAIARQLFTVALGKPVALPPVRQSRPLDRATRRNLLGDYEVKDPGFVVTIKADGDGLSVVSGGNGFAAYYIGDEGADPKLYIPRIDAELVFVGARKAPPVDMKFVQAGKTLQGKRR